MHRMALITFHKIKSSECRKYWQLCSAKWGQVTESDLKVRASTHSTTFIVFHMGRSWAIFPSQIKIALWEIFQASGEKKQEITDNYIYNENPCVWECKKLEAVIMCPDLFPCIVHRVLQVDIG